MRARQTDREWEREAKKDIALALLWLRELQQDTLTARVGVGRGEWVAGEWQRIVQGAETHCRLLGDLAATA